ncbi:hypothetical protein DFA_09295 [Cavenderia fasciculata]|uniref:Uncharacterized protein n=1 Tax=Cavenderia fasciculata TaxID=261658 RepID=F4Q783_CACFS|nr:uncharacterized protein DFA_09295 [Cavenderia fasciculata]EGG16265.1 hypothetical protein DFA_09295 [Cavenderia fasciculata]|eukprot:XP_004354649.1 hypothetical protein DFA_09295 [Cavenderia fasciculata]
MSMETGNRIPATFFPKGLVDLTLRLEDTTLDPWVLPQGLEVLHISGNKCPVSPEFIPDSVKDLTVDVSNPSQAIFPSGLVKLTTSTNYNAPFNYPPTLRELIFNRDKCPPPVIYLPTSLEEYTCFVVKIKDKSVYSLPTTKVINNDNSSITDNPLHFILPHRLKKINGIFKNFFSKDNSFSFRIDPIINCSNVEQLTIDACLDIYIRRLDNGDVMINSSGSFFGGIYRQQRIFMGNTRIENRSVLDFPALYLNFKSKANHFYWECYLDINLQFIDDHFYPTLSVLFDKELMEKELASFIKESDSIPEKSTRYYPKEMVSTSLDKQKKDEDEEEEDDDGDDEEEEEEDWLNYQKSDIIDWHHHNVNSFKQDKSPVLHIKMKIEVVDFIHRNRTESFSAKDLEKIHNINILRYLQHYRPDLVIGSSLFDRSIINQKYEQMKREHLSKLPSGSDPFFKYDTKLISRLMPSESFSQDINMQIIDTGLVCEVDEEKRDDFIQKIYNNKVKLTKPILDYLYNNGVPFKEYIIDSLLDIGDERLNDIDPKEFLETHVHNCASYENTQHLATRLLSIQRNILYLLDNGAPLSVFSELDLKKTSDFKVLQHNRRDCFKMVIDKLKEETKDMDIETGRKTIESVVDKMGFDRLGEGTECSTLMLEYCLELITKDLPSGILSQEMMEQRCAKLVKHYHFDLALVVSKYFNIGFDTIKKYKFSKIPFQAAIFFGNSFNLAFEDFPIELLSNLSQKQQDFLKDKFHFPSTIVINNDNSSPTTKVINNDNSSPKDNPHFILPYRLKKIRVMNIDKEIQHEHHLKTKTTTTTNNTTQTLAPGGGLSNLLLLKIVGYLDDIQDIACLLMTCKAYYIAFRVNYTNVITFKYVERDDDYHIIKQSMKPFQEIYKASYDQRGWFNLDRIIRNETEPLDSPIAMKDKPILINATVNQNNITRIPPTRKLTIMGNNIVDCNVILSKLADPRILESLEISNQHDNIDPLQVPSLKSLNISLTTQYYYIQFPLTLVELSLKYIDNERFSLDLLKLEQLTKLKIASNCPYYIHAKDIKIPKTSLKHLSIQFILYAEFEDFFPDTLESLDLQDINFLGDALPPPNLISMSIGNCEKILPANYFPSSLKSLKFIYCFKSFCAGALPLGLETLEFFYYNGPVTQEYIPDTITSLTIDDTLNTFVPSGLQHLTFGPDSDQDPPIHYPSTMRSINYRNSHPQEPKIINLPTSLESFSCDAVWVKTTNKNSEFQLPPTMVVNNDDSPLSGNPPHYVLPSRVTHLTLRAQVVKTESKLSFRLDTIINYSNVQDLSIIINSKREMKFKIRRLEPNSEYFMLHSKDSFDGAIVRQKRLCNNSMVNRSILEYYPLKSIPFISKYYSNKLYDVCI